jgi:hypothetical protein
VFAWLLLTRTRVSVAIALFSMCMPPPSAGLSEALNGVLTFSAITVSSSTIDETASSYEP